MEPEGSSPYTQEPATCPYPEPDWSSPCPYQRISMIPRHRVIFRNVIFYGEELLGSRPSPKLQDHPLVGCPRLLI
jgi:hypothetical protein